MRFIGLTVIYAAVLSGLAGGAVSAQVDDSELRALVAGCMRAKADLSAAETSCSQAITEVEAMMLPAAQAGAHGKLQGPLRRLRLQRASLRIEMGRYKAAFRDAVGADDPRDRADDAVLRFFKAVSTVGQGVSGRHGPSFTYLNAAVDDGPADIRFYARLLRAEAFTLVGDYDAAMADLDAAAAELAGDTLADRARKRADLNLYRGYALIDLGRIKAALDLFDKALSLFPEDAELYAARGLAYVRLGARGNAVDDYWKAIDLGHGHDAAAHRRLAWTFASDPQGLADPDAAVELARQAIAIDAATDRPTVRKAENLHVLATAHAAAGDRDAALQTYAAAADASPRLAAQYRASLRRQGVLRAAGRTDRARMIAALRTCLDSSACTVEADDWCGDLVDVPCVKARR